MLLSRILKKALPTGSAFLFWAVFAQAECLPSLEADRESVVVSKVFDGDTVKLADGRIIRLIGINTPETGKDARPSEYMADEAKARLQTLVLDGPISLTLGLEKKDRYGRWLGHLWRQNELISERLIREGYGYQISIPPNLVYRDCFGEAERRAQAQGVGLWQRSPWKAVTSLSSDAAGFYLLQGLVTKQKTVKKGWLLEVDKRLAVMLPEPLVTQLTEQNMSVLEGKKIRVRGWIRPKSATAPAHFMPWFIRLSHLDQLQFD